MKYHYKMESILVLSAVLCALLLLKIIYDLRSTLIWRVNCWFCNHNFWVKYTERNSWTCPKCDQYNGFTKDGDYNKVLNTGTQQISKSPKLFQRSPPKNGLCKMCNINQQLKVTQLANFVPMNENNYDEEIESYRNRLEKAYKLCSPCKTVLQIKLHKEKEMLLGSKLLESRTPDKLDLKKEKQKETTRNIINSVSNKLGMIIFILIVIECYTNAMKHEALHKNLSDTIYNIKQILFNLLLRIISIVKMKTLLAFPSLEKIIDIKNIVDIDIFTSFNSGVNDLTQLVLGGFICFIQSIGLFTNKSKVIYTMIIDTLWIVFEITCIGQRYVRVDPLIMSLIKLSSILAVLLVYRSMNKTVKILKRKNFTPKKLKNLANGSPKKIIEEDDSISLDTDDDVSLSKFGLHNFADSSNDTLSPFNSTLMNGRSFTPRSDSMWGKPKLNSTFCVNSLTTTSPNPLSNSVFVKPSFNKYQKLAQDSDSDLDESISSLCISSPKKKSSKINPVFALRKFTASPNFVAPVPMNKARPLISPSKLGHTTSWVAGGYWGTEGERQIFNVNVSRSSSQSSGFESQASSMNQRNIFSQPPSREESVCGEQDRLLDKCQNFAHAPAFTPISAPVFPQMQFNSHVQIPQPRVAQTFVSQSVFQQYAPNSIFKAPGGSRLIKLPQENFTPR